MLLFYIVFMYIEGRLGRELYMTLLFQFISIFIVVLIAMTKPSFTENDSLCFMNSDTISTFGLGMSLTMRAESFKIVSIQWRT